MKKISVMQSYLTVFFVVALLISNIVIGKQIQLGNLTLAAAVVVFPIVYILSDVFSEVYGYEWSRITCWLALIANLFMVAVFSLTIAFPYPDYFTGQEAFETVLGSTPRALIASALALCAGDWVNDKVFQKMKEKYPDSHKGFGWRAIISSVFGELTDSCIVVPILFLGTMPLEAMLTLIACQVLVKTGYEVLILPVTTFIVKVIAKREGTAERV